MYLRKVLVSLIYYAQNSRFTIHGTVVLRHVVLRTSHQPPRGALPAPFLSGRTASSTPRAMSPTTGA
eukprot:COSAG03_NODE_15068_length_442_cov_0.545190_1_plen_66_part_01